MHLHLEPLGDFEGEPAAGHPGLAENGSDRSREAWRSQLDRRDVHADNGHMLACQEFLAHHAYHPAAEIEDGPGPLGNRHEEARRDGRAVQHLQPHQGLDRVNAAGGDVTYGLIDQ